MNAATWISSRYSYSFANFDCLAYFRRIWVIIDSYAIESLKCAILGLLKRNELMCSYRVARILHAILSAWSVFHWVLEVPFMIVTCFSIRESMVSVVVSVEKLDGDILFLWGCGGWV